MTDGFSLEKRVTDLFKKTSYDSMSWDIDSLFIETLDNSCRSVTFLNAHAVNNAIKNDRFYQCLLQSDFLLRDGIGVKMAMKFFGLPISGNLNGTDLIPKILKKFKDKRIAIFGASMEALIKTQLRLSQKDITNVAALEHGFHDFAVYKEVSQKTMPDIIILCMGMPKQELLASELIAGKFAKLVVCGGGWADFYSETKKRAPLWVRKLSMEWIYRLLSEPRRLGKRYTIDVFYYFYIIIKAKLG